MEKIILASGSPRRRELLERIGLDFEVAPSDFQEDMSQNLLPAELAKALSFGKAQDVAKTRPGFPVLGADTLIAFENHVLGKPHTEERAREMLQALSGKCHSVITGFSIIEGEKSISKAVETKVYFKNLSSEEIDWYIKIEKPLDHAGAYAIQDRGCLFVERIEGDYFNIVGLPIFSVIQELKNFGFELK